jgi:sugar/nucleoside kinase (ribokinase family)
MQHAAVETEAQRTCVQCRQAAAPPPLLLSAVGRDAAGDALVVAWEALGASARCILRIEDAATPVVSIILDGSGEVCPCVPAQSHGLALASRFCRSVSRG